MQVVPVTLRGRIVRVEPLTLEHAPQLWEVARQDERLFEFMWTWPAADSLEEFRANLERNLDLPGWCRFAIVLEESGQAIGSTSFLDIRPEHRGLEIGSTWIGRSYQGTEVNPENKYLLLRHSFETLGAVRVQFKTDARNTRSQRAIARIGATLEGTLRKHLVLPDGYVRDSVIYSIIIDEWPRIKSSLETRLGYMP